ncbi:MAG: SRPBCC domain-containing protein [Chitinophagaceae bacterium]|nr:MAG: SRPBCC domain-containing protein [Chitinophagaceae bacterium]
MDNSTVFVEHVIEAPVADVWKAITDKEEMKKWYFTVEDFRLEKEFIFHFDGQGSKGEQYHHICVITEIDPGKKLQHTWRYQDFPGESLVTWELIPEGDFTRVQLTHQGLDSFPQDSPDFEKASFKQGWTQIITVMLAGFFKEKTSVNS